MPVVPSPDDLTLKHQLDLAADIQRYLLPKLIPRIEGYDMAAFYHPSLMLSGDYYDFIEVNEHELGVAVVDVSGKGFPAALVMAQVRALTRREALHSRSPVEMLSRINRYLYSDMPRKMFVSMFFALIDISRCTVKCVSAGHPPMLFWNAGLGQLESIKPKGPVLGVMDDLLFKKSVELVSLSLLPGDRVLLYTDGVSEAMNVRRELFGMPRLREAMTRMAASSAERIVAGIVRWVNAFRGQAPQHDDITLLVVGRTEENPSTSAGFTYLEGERFIRCAGCLSVNFKMYGVCRACGRPTRAPEP